MKRIARIILSVMFALPMLVGGGFMLSTNNQSNLNDLNSSTNVATLNPDFMGGGGQPSIVNPEPSDYPQPSVDPVDPIDPPSVDPIDPKEPSEDPDEVDPTDFDDSVYDVVMWNDKASDGYAGGSGTKEDPYQISTAEELAYLSSKNNEINSYSLNKYFVLTNDIHLNDGYFDDDGTYHDGGDGVLNQWTKIGKDSRYFSGSFDGKGHTIFGVYVSETSLYAGFFGLAADGAKIENLNIKNSAVISSSLYVGGFVGGSFITIEITNCSYDGIVLSEDQYTGGIIGYNKDKNSRITKCVNYAKIHSTAQNTGGIIGYDHVGMTITDCENYGEISNDEKTVGGIVGSLSGLVRYCKNYGKISGTRCGGIAGSGSNIANCENYGKISGTNLGGVVGLAGTANIISCKNYGSIETTVSSSGGIVGYATQGLISNCENYATLNGYWRMGGIIGYSAKEAIVDLCKNYGNITADHGGAIAGELASGSEIRYCENYGDLTSRYGGEKVIIVSDLNVEIYECLSIGKIGEELKKIAIVYDYREFFVDPKTSKIGLSNASAIGSFLGRMDKERFEYYGFTVFEVE